MTSTFKDFSPEPDVSQSMREFCDEYDLRRATVIDWCKVRDIPTDKGVGHDLKIQILHEFKPEAMQEETALAIIDSTGMHRQTGIELATPAQTEVLDSLLEQFQAPIPELNGTHQRVIKGVQTLALVVSTKEDMLVQRQEELAQRAATLCKTQQVIAAITSRNEQVDADIAATDDLAVQIAAQEAEQFKQLQQLGLTELPNAEAPVAGA